MAMSVNSFESKESQSNLDYRLSLQREFNIQEDLNKYTIYNYKQLERKNKLFCKGLERQSKRDYSKIENVV
jgi:hypothetical protein